MSPNRNPSWSCRRRTTAAVSTASWSRVARSAVSSTITSSTAGSGVAAGATATRSGANAPRIPSNQPFSGSSTAAWLR